eukprot:TRINITY_DN858_c0_g1_i1.p1 TRINITY_DN858_c0_g1~~TRINITY_DN858_c0_g1_i1.p1  ORF type:complete len:267 (+),score=74.69 TRINITY_DN858_c0_g1_i1:107-907(+)
MATAEQSVAQAKNGEMLEGSVKSGKGSSVMISYSRRDKAFVRNLYEYMMQDGRDVWVDWQDIPGGSDWFDEIKKGIEKSDCFVFVLSPHSIVSAVCNLEVDHAVKNGKRLIPIVAEDVNYDQVRKDLASVNWIFFRQMDEFAQSIKILFKALDADLPHARYHTILLIRALEWEKHDFEKSLLLHGNDLKRAQQWLSASALGKEPKPTTLHLSFITASQALASSMQKRKIIAVFFAFIVAIGIIWPSWGVFFFSLVFSHFFVYFSSN